MLSRTDILTWLRETDPAKLEELWRQADAVRRQNVGDEVHLRGLIEISNHCRRLCGYCGLNCANRQVRRYRMTSEEILACARQAVEFGYGTVVLQSGEDEGITGDGMADVIRRIKSDPATRELAVTLSLGERSDEELALWRSAGADRYLIRFETSNPDLYARIHPPLPGQTRDRFEVLRRLRELGYEVGSGVMIGIPGQSYDDLARDIEIFSTLHLDMVGVGPYIPHPDTALGRDEIPPLAEGRQVPNTELMTYKVVALTRLICPRINIPSTTALATLNLAEGRELGLQRGANIVMPNLTPPECRAYYEIYPAKACLRETARECHQCMRRRIESIGRTVGKGRGDSLRKSSPVG